MIKLPGFGESDQLAEILKRLMMNTKIFFLLWSTLLLFGIVSCSGKGDGGTAEIAASAKIEAFLFSSNGTDYDAKIYLPSSYETKNDLPAIFLIDFTDQHYEFVGDEFEKVIDGVRQIEGLEALVVSLENIPDIDAKPYAFQEYYQVYQDMASYVDGHYTDNPSRTFIGRGSEAGIVLLALFLENSENSEFINFIATDPPSSFMREVIDIIRDNDLSKNDLKKKLHFSFSTSNNGSTCNQLIELIEQSQYEWLDFESIQYTDSDYVHTYPMSFAAGIKFIFE